MIVTDRERTDL